ncbi:hypothetical protein DSO57_1003798 [Entomophthora muscae]|uniref:Uncharacterized protein n=1 Tax=Entomophthora muscae TaxID=34485 RepID=A0ACC2UHZ6_9FUNG|nr:hypothetical protein DSO57_1003798 [Entomophthora muscae]
MMLLVIKFVVFTLAPFLLLLWSTSPNLWLCLSSFACLVSDDPSSLLLFSSDLFTSSEAIVKSLTCNNLDLQSAESILPAPSAKGTSLYPPLMQNDTDSVSLQEMEVLPLAPSHASWLVASLVLMGLNSYFPQLSPVFSLWSPLRVAVSVIHWVASWCFVSPGWELNLVSLSPSLTQKPLSSCVPSARVFFVKTHSTEY